MIFKVHSTSGNRETTSSHRTNIHTWAKQYDKEVKYRGLEEDYEYNIFSSHYYFEIELNTYEKFLDFCSNFEEVIISGDELEIYDYWRE